jgi:hypothetical protein
MKINEALLKNLVSFWKMVHNTKWKFQNVRWLKPRFFGSFSKVGACQIPRVISPEPLVLWTWGNQCATTQWGLIRASIQETTATVFTYCGVPMEQPRIRPAHISHPSVCISSPGHRSRPWKYQGALLQSGIYLSLDWCKFIKNPFTTPRHELDPSIMQALVKHSQAKD